MDVCLKKKHRNISDDFSVKMQVCDKKTPEYFHAEGQLPPFLHPCIGILPVG